MGGREAPGPRWRVCPCLGAQRRRTKPSDDISIFQEIFGTTFSNFHQVNMYDLGFDASSSNENGVKKMSQCYLSEGGSSTKKVFIEGKGGKQVVSYVQVGITGDSCDGSVINEHFDWLGSITKSIQLV